MAETVAFPAEIVVRTDTDTDLACRLLGSVVTTVALLLFVLLPVLVLTV